jgi:hypothetical protein
MPRPVAPLALALSVFACAHAEPVDPAPAPPTAATALASASTSASTTPAVAPTTPPRTPHLPPPGPPGPSAQPGFPTYAPHPDPAIDALKDAAPAARDALCRAYCAEALGWPADAFLTSRIDDFFQTPESIDLRCDFAETDQDIGGSERTGGPWLRDRCAQRGLAGCYWSIMYAPEHQGRVACVRAVYVP